jgi:predicted GNAT superfamily acetyltransferase
MTLHAWTSLNNTAVVLSWISPSPPVRLSALLLQTFIIERDARVSSLRLTGLVKIAQPNS